MEKWNEDEINFLKENYSKEKRKMLCNTLHRKWETIKSKADRLGLKSLNENISWKKCETDFLIKNYHNFNFLAKPNPLSGRTTSSIINKAHILNLKKDFRLANLSSLCELTPEAYYWIGFLMADGHFSKTGSLQINLAIKDRGHLIKLAKFINYKNDLKTYKNYVNLSVSDKKNFNYLKDKFNITNNKTYVPCNILNIDDNLLFSLIIGFIDGDGCIKDLNNSNSLIVRCHKSWGNNLKIMVNLLSKNFYKKYKIKYIKNNLVYFSITSIELLKQIKLKVLELNLSVLERKWDKIDLNKLSKKETKQKYTKICFELFDKGLTEKQICEQTGFSHSVVNKNFSEYSLIKNKNFKNKKTIFKEKRIKIIEILKNGENNLKKISKDMNVSLITVQRCKRTIKEQNSIKTKDIKRETDKLIAKYKRDV